MMGQLWRALILFSTLGCFALSAHAEPNLEQLAGSSTIDVPQVDSTSRFIESNNTITEDSILTDIRTRRGEQLLQLAYESYQVINRFWSRVDTEPGGIEDFVEPVLRTWFDDLSAAYFVASKFAAFRVKFAAN